MSILVQKYSYFKFDLESAWHIDVTWLLSRGATPQYKKCEFFPKIKYVDIDIKILK